MKLGIYSGGIWKINGLKAFLPEYELLFREKADAVAGWGIKNTAEKAMKIAAENKLPYIALEDGFIRSYGLGVKGSTPFSMIVDDLGVYYDATRPSRVEELIAGNGQDIERARTAIAEIRRHKLSKYNNSKEKWNLPKGKYVLVVDQCAGDYSIKHGLASENSFREMLKYAREENEGAKLIIKIHPDVLAGKRQGYLKEFAGKDDILLADNINPHIIFDNVDKVYTVTSLLGMEALMAGKHVRCFGMPFYAGWGASEDMISIPRRNVKRTVEEIFNASYIDYTRYIDPYMQKPSALEDVIDNMAFIKNYYAKHSRNYYCLGFSGWKRHFTQPYISGGNNKVRYFRKTGNALDAARKDDNSAIMVWAAREKPELAAGNGAIPIFRMEDGFIRSAGLGSDLIAANSLIIDNKAIHFDHSKPSELEDILNNKDFTEAELARAHKLMDKVTAHSISKYNLQGTDVKIYAPEGKKKILVIGQVESDASIRFGALNIRTNAALIDKVRELNPDAYLIYKPHPDVLSGNRKGLKLEQGADAIITDVPIMQLIKQVDEVHVITSLAGFEAIMHDVKVVCHGVPFYHGWGLTEGPEFPRRNRKRSKLELFAAAIIEYPSYYDFAVNLPCRPEVVVDKIAGKILAVKRKRKYTRALNWVTMSLKR